MAIKTTTIFQCFFAKRFDGIALPCDVLASYQYRRCIAYPQSQNQLNLLASSMTSPAADRIFNMITVLLETFIVCPLRCKVL